VNISSWVNSHLSIQGLPTFTWLLILKPFSGIYLWRVYLVIWDCVSVDDAYDIQVILVENKAESVRRAVERIACSSANNITVVQCNLGRFHAPFDIGICLHACGVATDLVLAKCIVASASFVVSPCCYGSIRSGPSVKYPRSDIFQAAGLDYLEYLALGHAADQTQATIAKSGQGRVCMSIVDSDRCCLARQLGYTAQIFEMTPPTCSPKNHILTGWPSSSDGSI